MKQIFRFSVAVLMVLFPLANVCMATNVLTAVVSPADTAGIVYSDPDGIWCTDTCSAEFPDNSEVTLIAENQCGYRFDHWEIDGSTITTTSMKISMTSNKSITAVFVPIDNPQTVQVTVSPSDAGVVYSDPSGIWCSGECFCKFSLNDSIQFTATAESGYLFDHWEGDITGTVESQTLTISGPRQITAVFTKVPNAQTLTVSVSPVEAAVVSSSPGAIWCETENCTWDFPPNESVLLTASEKSGYMFDHWEMGGVQNTTGPSMTVVMDGPKTVLAVFKKISDAETLTVSVSPEESGVVSSDPGAIWCEKSGCTWDFSPGETVTLTADNRSGYVFDHWEGDLSGNVTTRSIVLDSPKTVTAVFKKITDAKTLTVSVQPTGSGLVKSEPSGIWCSGTSDCTWDFSPNQVVTLIAAADSGYRFVRWEGGVTSTEKMIEITNDSVKNVTAVFEKLENTVTLIVSVSPENAGIVSNDAGTIWCENLNCSREFGLNETVVLSAQNQSGYRFDHWEGDLTGGNSPQSLNLDSDKTVTAVFVPVTDAVSITVSVEPEGSGVVSTEPAGIWCTGLACSWEFSLGQSVQLTASPGNGYVFDHWEEDLSGKEKNQSMILNGEKRVTAVFIPGETINVDPGVTLDQLRMVSFTYIPDDNSVTKVFYQITAENYGQAFRLGRWNPDTGAYKEFGPDLQLEPGRAMWILARDGMEIAVGGTPVNPNENFELELYYNSATGDGWNMVAPPNNLEYDWSKIKVFKKNDDGSLAIQPVEISDETNNLVSIVLWKWQNGTYVYFDPKGEYSNALFNEDNGPDRGVMKPNSGYFVKAEDINVYLLFPAGGTVRSKQASAFSSVFNNVKKALSRISVTKTAIADSGDSPPAPIGAIAGETVKDGMGGCFIGVTIGGNGSERSHTQAPGNNHRMEVPAGK